MQILISSRYVTTQIRVVTGDHYEYLIERAQLPAALKTLEGSS